MPKITRFEDLKCWQLAREFANKIFVLTQKEGFSKDFSLKDQINRATGSIMDNVAEGFGRGGNKELINFLLIARGSALEVQSQLYRALDRKHILDLEFEEAYNSCEETIKLLTSFTNYLKNSDYQDYRNKPNVNEDEQIYELSNKNKT